MYGAWRGGDAERWNMWQPADVEADMAEAEILWPDIEQAVYYT